MLSLISPHTLYPTFSLLLLSPPLLYFSFPSQLRLSAYRVQSEGVMRRAVAIERSYSPLPVAGASTRHIGHHARAAQTRSPRHNVPDAMPLYALLLVSPCRVRIWAYVGYASGYI